MSIEAMKRVVEAFDALPPDHPARYANLQINLLRTAIQQATQPAEVTDEKILTEVLAAGGRQYGSDDRYIDIEHSELLKAVRAILALRPAAAPMTDEPVVKNGHMVMVDSGALQMVRNALQRDAGNGMRIRAEMLASLDAATHPAPGVPAWVVSTAKEVVLNLGPQEVILRYLTESDTKRAHGVMLAASPAQKGQQ